MCSPIVFVLSNVQYVARKEELSLFVALQLNTFYCRLDLIL